MTTTITSSGDYIIHIGTGDTVPVGRKFVIRQDVQPNTLEIEDDGTITFGGGELVVDHTPPVTFQCTASGAKLFRVTQKSPAVELASVHENGMLDCSSIDVIIFQSSIGNRPPNSQNGDMMVNAGPIFSLDTRVGGNWLSITLTP